MPETEDEIRRIVSGMSNPFRIVGPFTITVLLKDQVAMLELNDTVVVMQQGRLRELADQLTVAADALDFLEGDERND